MASLGGNFCRPRDISMYFITECLGLHTDSELRDRLPSSACIDAGLAVLLPRTWVECNSGDKPVGHKLASTHRCNMPHALVQLHDANNFDSIACLAFMRHSIQAAWGAPNECKALSLSRLDFKVTATNCDAISEGIKCPK